MFALTALYLDNYQSPVTSRNLFFLDWSFFGNLCFARSFFCQYLQLFTIQIFLKDKNRLRALYNGIVDEFKKMLKNNKWMDDYAKQVFCKILTHLLFFFFCLFVLSFSGYASIHTYLTSQSFFFLWKSCLRRFLAQGSSKKKVNIIKFATTKLCINHH